jgi:ubiquinone/menaquinone biosynthesis C-methylase UbiE
VHEKRFEGSSDRLRAPERVERLEVERVIDLCLEGIHALSILDVGMGTALFTEAFFRRGLSVSGIDANPEMVVASRSYLPAGDFQGGVAESLSYLDDSFDMVFFGLLLHETDDTLKALIEAYRVARKRVCILEWPYREQPFGPPLAHRLDPEILLAFFHQAGFQNWNIDQLENTTLYRLDK